MTVKPDEFDALRTIIETLKPFEQAEQRQLLRWAQEKLGIVAPASPTPSVATDPAARVSVTPPQVAQLPAGGSTDIKSFVLEKSPKGERQFAAVVAYFHQFEAPVAERKQEITKDDILAAARLAAFTRPKNPSMSLVNAHNQGFLDRTNTAGAYKISSVGENLVAMVLPSNGVGAPRKKVAKKKTSTKVAKKTAKTKA